MKIGPVGGSGPGGVADWQTARTAKLPRAGRLGVFLITAKLPWRFGTADGYADDTGSAAACSVVPKA